MSKFFGAALHLRAILKDIPWATRSEHLWGDNALQILEDKYYKPRVVSPLVRVEEEGIPGWLQRSIPADPDNVAYEIESSPDDVFTRMVGAWTYHGWKMGYFHSEDMARTYFEDMKGILAFQIGAPNSPQWFNTGRHWAYGIQGDSDNHWRCDPLTGEIIKQRDIYEHPQVSACFVTGVEDNLVGKDGIFHFIHKEATLFQQGSGSGANFTNWREENAILSKGGVTSGLLSHLKVVDHAAGAVRSGGGTRRAAKIASLDADHKDIHSFISCKSREEDKVAAMIVGSRIIRQVLDGHLSGVYIPPQVIRREKVLGRKFPLYDEGWESAPYETVAYQNTNHSVRVTDDFMERAAKGESWTLYPQKVGEEVESNADKILEEIAIEAWACGDPGIQFHDKINKYNGCVKTEKIVASNPCAEYNGLNDTSCNLASMRLTAFYNINTGVFDYDLFKYVVFLWTLTLDISGMMASFPDPKIARKTWEYRALGLGYGDLGGLLLRMCVPYQSEEGRAIMSRITGIMTAFAYEASALLAADLGSFPQYEANKEGMLAVVELHARFHEKFCSKDTVYYSWRSLLALISKYGLRNSQLTNIAPTGTIGFVMGCDTTGCEIAFRLLTLKYLAGGGFLEVAVEAIPLVLAQLGYTAENVEAITSWLSRTDEDGKIINATLKECPFLQDAHKPIFATAKEITPEAHVLALGAISPLVSGGVSKTVNVPKDATPQDIRAIYTLAWSLEGVRAISVYREGSKLSDIYDRLETPPQIDTVVPTRTRLPEECPSRKFVLALGGHKVYMHTGEYEDGRLAEIFLSTAAPGGTLTGLLRTWAITLSLGLQHGIPLSSYAHTLKGSEFEPRGIVTSNGSTDVRFASSIIDLVLRVLEHHYGEGSDRPADAPKILPSAPATRPNAASSTSFLPNPCSLCGAFTLVPTGSCSYCVTCNESSGCS